MQKYIISNLIHNIFIKKIISYHAIYNYFFRYMIKKIIVLLPRRFDDGW